MNRMCAVTVGLLIAFGSMLPGCSRRNPADKEKVQSVTEQAPELQPQSLPERVQVNAPAVASKGDCAPRFKNGLTGTCINDQPCRGFGVLNEKHQAVCSCYGLVGGCQVGERCDTIHKNCVPEEELPFERAPTH